MTAAIFLCIFVFAIKYRRRSDTERPKPIHGSMAVEITWSIIPLGIFLLIFGWGAKVYFTTLDAPENSLRIYVMGKQWMWKAQHPDGQSEINELHVPVGRPVQLILTSQDVIHSFYIPAFRMKRDAVPGRYSSLWFQATKPGAYHLFCAEYCGTEHSYMRGTVTVMRPADYERWLAGGAGGDTMAAAGRKLFERLGCVNCHGKTCPALEGVYQNEVPLASGQIVRADDAYLRESILDPGAKIVAGFPNLMPSFRGQVSEEDLMKLLAYIRSLGAPGAAGSSPQQERK